MPAVTYRVRSTTNLFGGPWIDLPGDATASGPLAAKVDSRGTDAQTFHRIILIP